MAPSAHPVGSRIANSRADSRIAQGCLIPDVLVADTNCAATDPKELAFLRLRRVGILVQGLLRHLWREILLKGECQTQAIDGGANHEVRVVEVNGPFTSTTRVSPSFSNSQRYGRAEAPRRLMDRCVG
jgi:hypothetical protein